MPPASTKSFLGGIVTGLQTLEMRLGTLAPGNVRVRDVRGQIRYTLLLKSYEHITRNPVIPILWAKNCSLAFSLIVGTPARSWLILWTTAIAMPLRMLEKNSGAGHWVVTPSLSLRVV